MSSQSVNKGRLVEKAKNIVKDPQLGFASAIEYPVQDVTIGDDVYQLSIKLALKK